MGRSTNHMEEKTDIPWKAEKKIADGLYELKGSNHMKSAGADKIRFILDRLNENERIQQRFHELNQKYFQSEFPGFF